MSKKDTEAQKELSSISNTSYSRANKNSFYNKQKQVFEKNIQSYDESNQRQLHVHKHVKEITEIFKNIATNSLPSKRNGVRWMISLCLFNTLYSIRPWKITLRSLGTCHARLHRRGTPHRSAFYCPWTRCWSSQCRFSKSHAVQKVPSLFSTAAS